MASLDRLLLVRHGETEGESSTRFHGRTDVRLSAQGRDQARRVAEAIPGDAWPLVVSSALSRAWETAQIVLPGKRVVLESDFNEVDFGRWEGLTREEIEALDPILYEDWQARLAGFEFPQGERRADFRARVCRGLDRILARDVHSAVVVAHKGVIRIIVEVLTGEPLEDGSPELGGVLQVSRAADGRRFLQAGPRY